MSDYKIIKVLDDKHQFEFQCLQKTVDVINEQGSGDEFLPALVSRMSWLEYQAKLKVESILNLCKTGI